MGMDALEVKDFNGVRYTAINIVDMGTNFPAGSTCEEWGGVTQVLGSVLRHSPIDG